MPESLPDSQCAAAVGLRAEPLSLQTSLGSGGFECEGCFAFRSGARWKSLFETLAGASFHQPRCGSQNRRDPPSLGDVSPRPPLFPSGTHQRKLWKPQSCPGHRGGLSLNPSGQPTLALHEPSFLPNSYGPTRPGDPLLARGQSDRNTHKTGKSQKLSSVTSSIHSLSPGNAPPALRRGNAEETPSPPCRASARAPVTSLASGTVIRSGKDRSGRIRTPTRRSKSSPLP